MQIILQENIRNLGSLGDQVKVKPGYARNYLLPQGKAVPVTVENIALFEQKRAELEKAAADVLQKAQERAKNLEQLASITITTQASEEGKLYGALGVNEIVKAVTESGVEIHKKEVNLPEGPIRAIGEYSITMQFHTDVEAVIVVKVEQEVG